MAGNKIGGLKAAQKNKANDPEFYAKLGRKSQEAWKRNGRKPRGFSAVDGLAVRAGAKGGLARAFDHDLFIHVWQTSQSCGEAASRLKIDKTLATTRAAYLRHNGYPLKTFRRVSAKSALHDVEVKYEPTPGFWSRVFRGKK